MLRFTKLNKLAINAMKNIKEQQILDEKKLFSEYNLDCEYNRNGSKPKKIISLKQNVYPDLIIHQRGSNDMNLLVMEWIFTKPWFILVNILYILITP